MSSEQVASVRIKFLPKLTRFFLLLVSLSAGWLGLCIEPVYGQVTVYGPKTFVRDTGTPKQVTDTFLFSHPRGEFALTVQNNEVTSAVITFNGVLVVGPNDFSKQVATIQRPVSLQKSNTLAVEVRGKPGTFISISIAGTPLNNIPTANAGPDQTVFVGETAQLDGSKSTDPDGDPLTFAWSLTTKPEGSTAVLSNPITTNPIFTVDRPGTYIARLVTNDGLYNSTPATVMFNTASCAEESFHIKVEPPSGVQGKTLNVVISGSANFETGLTKVSFGDGITVNYLVIDGLDRATANITIADNATIGNHNIIAVTGKEVLCSSSDFTTAFGFYVSEKTAGTPVSNEAQAAFEAFKVQNKQATVQWNDFTGTPRTVHGFLSRVLTGSPEEKAHQFLSENHSLLLMPQDLNDLQLINVVKLGGAEHIRFLQTYQRMPVYNTEVSVHIKDDTSQAQLLHATYYPNIAISNEAEITDEQAVAIVKDDLNPQVISLDKVKSELIVYPYHPNFLLAWRVTTPFWEYLIQADNGKILSKIDQTKSATGKGNVYLENPEVNQSLSSVDFYNLDSTGLLKGLYADVNNYASTRASNSNLEFNYQPGDTNFNEAMVYYHIDIIHDFFRMRGFYELDNPVIATVHFNCVDNARFSPSTKELYFCEPLRFKDTAKYADVIYHEYTHAVINKIKPGGLNYDEPTFESGAIEEGTGDFFSSSALRYPCLAEWLDPTKPCLRNLNNTKTILDKNEYVYNNAEIWGGACWDLFNNSYSEEVDRLILGAIAYLPYKATFIDGLLGVFHADRNLYQGKYCHQIYDAFNFHRIRLDNNTYPLPPVIVSPTNDFFQIYINDSGMIEADACDPNGDSLSYRWENSGGTLSDTGFPNRINWTAPAVPGDYTITLTVDDGYGGRTLKTITARVTEPPPPPVSIEFFRYGPNPFSDYINFLFKINVTATVTIKIFNVAGDLVMERSDVADGGQDIKWTLDTKNLARGIYFAVIYAGSDSKRVEKMAKN